MNVTDFLTRRPQTKRELAERMGITTREVPCGYCARAFTSIRGRSLHMSSAHPAEHHAEGAASGKAAERAYFRERKAQWAANNRERSAPPPGDDPGAARGGPGADAARPGDRCRQEGRGRVMTETDGRWRHASGDDGEGCILCWIDQDEQGLTGPNIRPCTTPEDDPVDPGLCRWCSHTVERAA